MWDGEWNAGGGVHDANATSWVDLVAGIELAAQYSPVTWNDNSLSVVGKWVTQGVAPLTYLQSFLFDAPKISGGGYTIEIVSQITSSGNHNLIGQRFNSVTIFSYTNKICGWLGNGNNTVSNQSVGQIGTATFEVVNNGTSCDNIAFSNAIQSQLNGNRSYNGTLNTNGIFGIGSGEYDSWGVAEGDYYCIRLYSRALTAEEIAANYAIDKARFNLP
jgi:hypothetical protein